MFIPKLVAGKLKINFQHFLLCGQVTDRPTQFFNPLDRFLHTGDAAVGNLLTPGRRNKCQAGRNHGQREEQAPHDSHPSISSIGLAVFSTSGIGLWPGARNSW